MSSTIAVGPCDAEACGFLCLQACPLGVLLAVPRRRYRGLSARPLGYVIAARFHGLCNGCGACVEVCPQGTIHLKAA